MYYLRKFHHARAYGFTVISLSLLFFGCSSTPDPIDSASQDIDSSDEQIFVGDSIEMSYDPNVIMKRAESFFEKESYAEAIVEYKHFLDLHRNHMLAPYAQYKIGKSHFKQFRTVDRDPEPLQKAIIGFEKLLKEFPESRYSVEAKETILSCKEQLVQRHLMVGEFYFKRESYLAAAHRYEKIIKEFPDIETTGEAIFQLAKTYQDLGIEEWTQDWLVTLIEQYPDSPYHSSAKTLLASLHEEHPTLLASLSNNPLSPKNSDSQISPDRSPAPALANPDFANAGILPNPSGLKAQPAIFTQSARTPLTCTIGTWCDPQLTQPSDDSTSTPTNAKTCKTGDWC